MTIAAPKPLRIFCSYSHKDEDYLNELRAWLRGLERQGQIEWWHDREIVPGWEWEEAIDKNLRTADIIFLLVTPDFMASDYVFEREIDRAIERHERGEARVIPIIVRPALWKGTSLNRLQALPKDAKPITRWPDRDEGWLDVAEGIQKSVEELLVERQQRAATKERYRKAVEETWADNKVSDAEAKELGVLASELNLSTDTTVDIERSVMGDAKEAILEHQEQVSREKERRARERQDRLDELYAQAHQAHEDQEWQAIVEAFEQIHAEDPAYPDREGLLAAAREALEARELAQRVAAIYAEGQRYMDAGEWQQALERFEEVQRLEPGYQDTERMLSRVRQEQSHRTEQAEASSQSRERMAGHPTSQAERVQPGEFSETRPRPVVPVGSGHWWALALRGAIAILFGLAALLWPDITLEALILLFGAYALVDGVFSIVGVFGGTRGGTPRWLLFIEGVAGILAGLIAFVLPQLTAILLLYLIAAWAIVTGISEIAMAIRLRKEIRGEWAMIVGGALSVLFGVLLAVVGPAVGLLSLIWLIGVYAVAFGIMLLIAGFRVRSEESGGTDRPSRVV